MDWTLTSALLVSIIVTVGALLQAATGLGAGLIVVPLLALVSTDLVPGPMIFGSLALSATMTILGRRNIDFSMTRPILVGVLVGTILAALYISQLPIDALGLIFGVFVLVAVAISARAHRFTFSAKGNFVAGTASGILGTSAGIGAPVLAMLYQHFPGPALRATLAFLYLVSSVLMLFFLNVAGRFGINELVSGMYLVPGFVIGYFLSPRLAAYIDKGFARPMVLIVSTASACLLIWRSYSALSIPS